MNAQILIELERLKPIFRDAIAKFTPEDWDRVYVGACLLTAETKVAAANKAVFPACEWCHERRRDVLSFPRGKTQQVCAACQSAWSGLMLR